MRLLYQDEQGGFKVTKDLTNNIPSYAILSHTWGPDEDEVTFDDLERGSGQQKAGHAKIQFCAQQAKKDHLDHFWVDTCCIDKTNSTELAGAINSMFRWYRDAAKCYVFLSDTTVRKRDYEGTVLPPKEACRKSRWFTRGWTLQELLAPREVEFFSRDGDFVGNKRSLEQEIHEITTIPVSALQGRPLCEFNVDEKMGWALHRTTTKPEDRAYCLLGIFGVFMHPIYGEEDHAFSRLKDEIGKLDRAHKEAFTINLQAETLASLSFDQLDSRRATIKNAYASTCGWLLQHQVYQDWTDPRNYHDHHGFLWIWGKAGAGKSTLMKFAHAHAEQRKSENDIVISFFFNARGEQLEKNTTGMWRSLLFQLLQKAVDLQDVLDNIALTSQQKSQLPEWKIEQLCALLIAALARLKHRRLKCFVDALDECDEDQVREMMSVFEDLGERAAENGTQIYMMFASRPYPAIDTPYGQVLTLENEEGHAHDVAKYVGSHLRAGKGKSVAEAKTEICERANGVFMWAVLVTGIINREFLRGRNFAIRRRLREIPTELSALLKDMLRRDNENMADLLLCLQWIMFARRPLTKEEFYFAMVAGLDPSPENLAEWNPEYITLDAMKRFVVNSSKGLAELTMSESPTVQFIHESIRDFLIKENGLNELWPDFANNLHSLSHSRLKDCCQIYLIVDLSKRAPLKVIARNTRRRRNSLGERYPFLDYASQYLLHHADEAARGISQSDFLDSFPLVTWLKVSNLLQRSGIRRHTTGASLVYLLAENNCPRLIKTTCRARFEINTPGERFRYPLFAALNWGNNDALQALLEVGANIEVTGNDGRTALSWASEYGRVAAVQILVNRGADVNARDRFHDNALYAASFGGHDEVVQILLDKGADVNARGGYHDNALYAASFGGHDEVVQILLDKGADVNARGRYDDNALYAASFGGHEAIVQMLLDKGADVNANSGSYRSALEAASMAGHEAVVQMLVDKEAYVNPQSWH